MVENLVRLDAAREGEIAVRRADGTLRRAVPVWVVCAGSRVCVRTWYRRDTGWFGEALRSHRARLRIEEWEAEAGVVEVGQGSREHRDAVDAACRVEYRSFGAVACGRPEARCRTPGAAVPSLVGA
jgi:hypothetical protein